MSQENNTIKVEVISRNEVMNRIIDAHGSEIPTNLKTLMNKMSK